MYLEWHIHFTGQNGLGTTCVNWKVVLFYTFYRKHVTFTLLTCCFITLLCQKPEVTLPVCHWGLSSLWSFLLSFVALRSVFLEICFDIAGLCLFKATLPDLLKSLVSFLDIFVAHTNTAAIPKVRKDAYFNQSWDLNRVNCQAIIVIYPLSSTFEEKCTLFWHSSACGQFIIIIHSRI